MPKYIIVGDNNYWYTSFNGEDSDARNRTINIARDIEQGVYDDAISCRPEKIFCYEVKRIEEEVIDNQEN